MKIRNVILMLIVTLLTVGSVFANRNGEDNGKAKLVVLGYGDDSTPDGQAFVENIKAFQEANPNIEIEWDMQYDELYHQKLQAMLAGGDQLDIAYMWNGGARYQPILDSSENIDQKPFIDPSLYDADALIGGCADGSLGSIPISKGAHTVMFANTDLLAELGLEVATTYDELLAQDKVARAKGKIALAYPGATSWCNNTFLYSVLLGRFGGVQHVKDLIVKKANYTDAPTVKAFEFIKKIYDDGIFDQNTVQSDYGTSLAQFNNSEALYFIDGGWRASQVTVPSFTWEQFPAVPGEKFPGTGNGGYSAGYAILKTATTDPARKVASIKLLQYLTGEKASIVRAKITGAVPAFKVKGTLVYKKGTEPAATYIGSLSAITDTIGDYIPAPIADVFNEGIIAIGLGKITPQELAKKTEAAKNEN